jgi:hypothetical protein
MTHPEVFQPVVTGLEALRTPAEMGQELFQGSKAVDILDFSTLSIAAVKAAILSSRMDTLVARAGYL